MHVKSGVGKEVWDFKTEVHSFLTPIFVLLDSMSSGTLTISLLSFHAIKDEMFLRQTLQRQEAILHNASVSFAVSSFSESDTVLSTWNQYALPWYLHQHVFFFIKANLTTLKEGRSFNHVTLNEICTCGLSRTHTQSTYTVEVNPEQTLTGARPLSLSSLASIGEGWWICISFVFVLLCTPHPI